MKNFIFVSFLSALVCCSTGASGTERLRLIIETDAGGDPDDEQSLVRFLLYANEWDVEGIIANRPLTRERENLNSERTGLRVVQRLINAYGECHSNLVQHDPRFPSKDLLWQRTVAGYDNTDDAVNLIMSAIDQADPRPLWYSDWGTDNGAAMNNLKRALDRVLPERGPGGYARFKSKLRLTSYDMFGEHTTTIAPLFKLWINTFQPPMDGKRWYHRFSAITASAGGFDLARDVLNNHGPLGALYPTNTTHQQKEGDTMTFLYLVPTGMNDPEQPTWGSWAGRYGHNEKFPGKPYYWANQTDAWQGTTNRDNTLARWAAALQNDFRARLDWCVQPFQKANHPPVARIDGNLQRTVPCGTRIDLNAESSKDPDEHALSFQWEFYPEPGTWTDWLKIENADQPRASFRVPDSPIKRTIHIVLTVTDSGSPPLSRYQRMVIVAVPR
ncbi:MAG: nucleoside hydrolase-like domain-containing protein [Verrucomicrobiales bacterium]